MSASVRDLVIFFFFRWVGDAGVAEFYAYWMV